MGKAISRLLIGVLLFAQFALAGYACPSLMGTAAMADAQSAIASSDRALPAAPAALPTACDQIDPDAASLCAEHCHQGHQSAGASSVPVVNLGIPTFLYSLTLEPQHALGSGRSYPVPDARLEAAPEPPHAILHCVLRL